MNASLKSDLRLIPVFLLLFFILSSCSNHEFKIKGEIYGGEGENIVLEKSDFNGLWQPLDSVKINRNGGFSISFPAPSSPEIFRLALNGQYVYIPIDSTETITLTGQYQTFGHNFSLIGSGNAERLASFEKDLQQHQNLSSDSLSQFKRDVYTKYMKDFPGSIVGFYILTKTIGDKPLYNPADPGDRKYFGAVATGFKSVRPDDPHTSLLENTTLQALKQKNRESGKVITLDAEEIVMLDIELPDENGKNIKLSDITGKGKPVVLIFSLLNHPESPELNIALANLYKKHGGKIEFYNVSFDSDQYNWRDAARNLPWITVYAPEGFGSESAVKYNVNELPAFFIYSSEGELKARCTNLQELEKEL